jgi:hypothetical protein
LFGEVTLHTADARRRRPTRTLLLTVSMSSDRLSPLRTYREFVSKQKDDADANAFARRYNEYRRDYAKELMRRRARRVLVFNAAAPASQRIKRKYWRERVLIVMTAALIEMVW